MWKWLRKLISPARLNDVAPMPVEDYKPMAISQLYVEPDEGEDFDTDAYQRLLAKIVDAGATTVDAINNIAVSIEDFFDGNRTRHSIAANVEPAPPYDTAVAWAERLKAIRSTNGVNDVVVEISMVEPYEDGRVGMWPYSDTIWVYSSLDRENVASLVSPLEPDEVRDASLNDPKWELIPPYPAPNGIKPFWVWWD